MSEKLYIIIVTYNAEKWIKVFAQSFAKIPELWKVIIVDNASNDNTVEFLRKHYPHFHIIENRENLGFGRANNLGLSMALNEGADFAFLLNQDASIEPEALNKLVQIQMKNPKYFILSPLQYDLDGKNLNGIFAAYCNPYACPNLLGDVFNEHAEEVYQAKFVNAAAWLLSRRCLEEVGGFNPAFFLYSEDDEYAKRVNFHGGKIAICPKASATHHDRVISKRPMGHKFFKKLAEYFDPSAKISNLKLSISFLDSLFRAFGKKGHAGSLIKHGHYLFKNKLIGQKARERLKLKAPHFL